MKTENVLYTDGHDVTVTKSALQVKKKWYYISGITKHTFTVLQPNRLPIGILFVFGALLEIVGSANLIPSTWVPNIYLFNLWVRANELVMGFGILFFLIGAVWMFLTRDRYAVSISTAEGEINAVVSKRKAYILQIVSALNKAFFARIPQPRKDKKEILSQNVE